MSRGRGWFTCIMFYALCVGCDSTVDVAGDATNSGIIAIPLENIWIYDPIDNFRPSESGVALRMAELEAELPDGEHLVRPINLALDFGDYYGQSADELGKPGFAVQGTGLIALREVHAVIVDGRTPVTEFSAGDEVTAVFFSQKCSDFVRISKVTRLENDIKVEYRIVKSSYKGFGPGPRTVGYALIPLGRLKAGSYRVYTALSQEFKANEGPVSQERAEELSKVVCQTYQFKVTGRTDE